MSLGTILLIVLVLLLIGAIPSWPHSRGWGYGPSGGLGLVVLILIVHVQSISYAKCQKWHGRITNEKDRFLNVIEFHS